MKGLLTTAIISVFLTGINPVFAGERGTAAEAEALVKKAVAYLKSHSREEAFAKFQDQEGGFVDKDLYIFVYDLNGNNVAHGANINMVGKNLLNAKDGGGKYYVRERLELAKNKDKFWQDYKFFNPMTQKIESKTSYREKVGDLIVGCGVYKDPLAY